MNHGDVHWEKQIRAILSEDVWVEMLGYSRSTVGTGEAEGRDIGIGGKVR